MRYHVCQFSGETNNFDFFNPNLPKNGFWGRNFKNLSADSGLLPPRDHVCQFSVKIDDFDFFGLNLGKLPNYVRYFGSNNVEGCCRDLGLDWNELGGEGGCMVIPTFLIWRKNDILFSRYLDFCAFVKSTDFKICDIIVGITSSGISTSAYFFWILGTLKKKFGQILV